MSDRIASACVPNDASLPWLTTALDRDAMAHHFTSAVLPAFAPAEPRRFALSACEIDHVRYRPGRNCAIAYRLRVLDTLTQMHHDLRFHGRMYPPDSAASRHAKACLQPLEQPPLGPPLHLISSLDMVLWAFPNERKLIGLGAVLDDRRLAAEVLPEVIAAGWGAHWDILRCQRDVIHYTPEHTLTLRVRATLRHTRSGELRPVAMFAKCYHDDTGARTLHTLSALSRQRTGRLRTPTALCYQPSQRVLWQTALNGVPLADLLHERAAAFELLRQAGEQIGALHASPVRVDMHLGFMQLSARIDKAESLLASLLGETGTLAKEACEALRRHMPVDDGHAVLLHGDLHAKNLLAGSAGMALIDMDNCVMGPSAWDLGSFIAALIANGCLQADRHRQRGLIDALLDGYGKGVPEPEALDWSIACALVIERAGRGVSRLKAGRLSGVPALLQRAQKILRYGWREALS